MADALWQPWSLRELVNELASGATDAEGALRRSQDRVAATEPEVAAWVVYDSTAAPTAEGPLAGVPFGVKDIIDLAGFPSRLGSPLFEDAPPRTEDAPVVAAWRAAGAIPVGKTVTAEFAFFTPGATRNPAAAGHTPGSSSSGSAAAVAAGHVPLAIGTQTGASTTRPASYCGIAGLTIAAGRFSFDGCLGISPSLDRHGILAATADDLALAWSALTGTVDVGTEETGPPRLLLWTGEMLGVVEDQMLAVVQTVAAELTEAGALVDPFPLDRLTADLVEASRPIQGYEVRTERAEQLAVADQISERWVTLREQSEAVTEADYDEAQSLIAGGLAQVRELLADYEAIIGPAATGPAPAGLGYTGDPTMSIPWQTLRLPQVAIAGPRDAAGLPLGLQVIALDEPAALRAAIWIERHLTGAPHEGR